MKWCRKNRHFSTNNMHVQKAVENIGLSKTEASVYLASLELGESIISDIAKAVRLPRSTCYEAMENLTSLGLINVLIIGSRKLYKAADPEKLLAILKERESLLKVIVPQLKLKHHTHNKRPNLYLYQGKEALIAVLDDILEKQYPLYAITSIDDILEVLGAEFKNFMEKRQKKHLRVRLLTSRTGGSVGLKERDGLELRQTKFLPSSFSSTTANFIYGNRIAILSVNAKPPFGLIIDDPDIARTYRNLFEVIWNHSAQ